MTTYTNISKSSNPTYSNTSKNSTSWTNQSKGSSMESGGSIGLLLSLTYAGVIQTSWTNLTKS